MTRRKLNKISFPVALPKPLLVKLDKEAIKKSITRTSLIQVVLENYYKEKEK